MKTDNKDEMLEIIRKLANKIDNINDRLDKMEVSKAKLSSNDKPEFHSLSDGESNETILNIKDKSEVNLNDTVERIVKEFRIHPPKEKVI